MKAFYRPIESYVNHYTGFSGLNAGLIETFQTRGKLPPLMTPVARGEEDPHYLFTQPPHPIRSRIFTVAFDLVLIKERGGQMFIFVLGLFSLAVVLIKCTHHLMHPYH